MFDDLVRNNLPRPPSLPVAAAAAAASTMVWRMISAMATITKTTFASSPVW